MGNKQTVIMKLINSMAYILACSFILLLAFLTHNWYEYTYFTYYCMGDGVGSSVEGDIYANILRISIYITSVATFVVLIIKFLKSIIRIRNERAGF